MWRIGGLYAAPGHFGETIRKDKTVLDISQFLQDYDAATQDVINGNYRDLCSEYAEMVLCCRAEKPIRPFAI